MSNKIEQQQDPRAMTAGMAQAGMMRVKEKDQRLSHWYLSRSANSLGCVPGRSGNVDQIYTSIVNLVKVMIHDCTHVRYMSSSRLLGSCADQY
jgi:hypothetical protein